MVVALVACGPGGSPSPAAITGVKGTASAGPTCPVETVSPAPNCADRPVSGATIIIKDEAGKEVASTQTDKDGRYAIPLPAGDFTLIPQPVEGILGTPRPQRFRIGPSDRTFVVIDLPYDTGIR